MKVINLVLSNWEIFAPVILLILSEIMSLNPKWKANGIIQWVINLIKK
jgi:hypothetical protein